MVHACLRHSMNACLRHSMNSGCTSKIRKHGTFFCKYICSSRALYLLSQNTACAVLVNSSFVDEDLLIQRLININFLTQSIKPQGEESENVYDLANFHLLNKSQRCGPACLQCEASATYLHGISKDHCSIFSSRFC